MLKQRKVPTFDQDKVIRKISRYRVVSFDIFDTLIKRDCAEGRQLFKMMERALVADDPGFLGFEKARIKAESSARQICQREDINLDDIYMQLENTYSNEQVQFLKAKEVEFELITCHRSHHMTEVYDYCIKNKKTVVLTSDMYLPREVIEAILKKSGITGYQKLYLSSEIGLRKHTGHLYDYIIKDLGVSRRDIIHIGDSAKDDIIRARQIGMATVYVPHELYSNLAYNKNLLQGEDIEDYRLISSFIDNRITSYDSKMNDYYERVGYEMQGPLLAGFATWLKEEFDREGIQKVFFLSRDGQIMEKAYRTMWGEDREIAYMYASRRALIVPGLWLCKSMEEMTNFMVLPKYGTVEAFIRRVGLDTALYESLAGKYGYDYSTSYLMQDLLKEEKFKQFYDALKEDIVANSKAEYTKLLKYLNQISFDGKVAIIDIGWHGNMQKALQNICTAANIDADIYGFYLGLNPNTDCASKGLKAKGYLFQRGYLEDIFKLERVFISVLETMFTADHGSVKSYEESRGEMIPVLEEYERTPEELSVIKRIQAGALDFLSDVHEQTGFMPRWSPNASFQNLILMGTAPDYTAACYIGDMRHSDDDIGYIARPGNSLAHMLTHPSLLREGLSAIYWKPGYFRRLCKVDLPYYEIYTAIRDTADMLKKRKI